MAKANLRIKEINKILSKASNNSKADDDDSDDDSDLEDMDGLQSELIALQKSNTDNQSKLDYYEKHKKWNVDNMCHVVEERTIVNKNVKENKFSEGGFALPSEEEEIDLGVEPVATDTIAAAAAAATTTTTSTDGGRNEATNAEKGDVVPTGQMSAAKIEDGGDNDTKSKASSTTPTESATARPATVYPQPNNDPSASATVSALSYHQFTQKYANIVEKFMSLESMDASQEYLLQHGHILLQENASNYLLLASLEDEMNGFHEKMKLVARQSQIISNIAELAKSLKLHPGNVIHPFFLRMRDKALFQGFMEGVNEFAKRIEVRAVQKRKEMDAEREREMKEQAEGGNAVDITEIPLEERLGPGGLDPLEVFESLPESMQEAFESREKEKLEAALRELTPEEVDYHMKRCIDAGLWNA
jgi:cell division cycle protein 37